MPNSPRMPDMSQDNLVDMKELMDRLRVKSRSSVYKYVAEDPDFPRPCKLSGRRGRVKFKASEVARYIDTLQAQQ